jgi:dipeptidyl aminopeptidase/acylaminoacyl peptidase
VTLQSGVYRCAVSDAGVADLQKMWGRALADPSKNLAVRFWDRYTGVKDPNDAALNDISPIKHVDKITVPVLLIHGQDDTVVPIEQSWRMQAAMKAAGKPIELVTLKSEDHWLSRSETRQEMLDATVKFLEANNPPQ